MSALRKDDVDIIALWAARYLGLPYKEKGRDRAGLDDWGLYRLIVSEQFGIALPSFVKETDAYIVEDTIANFVPTDQYCAPHVAMVKATRGSGLVVAMVVSNQRALTMERGKKSCLIHLGDFEHTLHRWRMASELFRR